MKSKSEEKTTPLVKIENLYKWYGKVKALERISIEVHPGKIVGLLGDNGAGKSTLVKVLSGVLPKNKGKIY